MGEKVKLEFFKGKMAEPFIFNPTKYIDQPDKMHYFKRDSIITELDGRLSISSDSNKCKSVNEELLFSIEFPFKDSAEFRMIKNIPYYHILHHNFIEKRHRYELNEKTEILVGKYKFKIIHVLFLLILGE